MSEYRLRCPNITLFNVQNRPLKTVALTHAYFLGLAWFYFALIDIVPFAMVVNESRCG